jgi:hypothetical protein
MSLDLEFARVIDGLPNAFARLERFIAQAP